MILRHTAHFSAPLAAFLIVALAVFWSVFAPVALGGQATYVVINGNSMEPLYHRGDLVILRYTDEAQVGDIFAYRYPDLGTVIHRLRARDGQHFIFKGDHNSWNDGYHPEWNDLVGKAWIHIPNIGNTLMWLRQPLQVALLAGLIGGLFMFGLVFNPPGQTDKKKKKGNDWLKFLPAPSRLSEGQNAGLLLLSLLLFVGVVLAIASFSRPVTRTVEDNVYYAHSANYRYTAPADPKVYDQSTIQSGEPVFAQLTCKLDISMDYAMASSQSLDVKGSYRMFATVSEFNGWKRTLELIPSTAFTNAAFHGAATLDTCAIRQMIDDAASLTGLARPTYNLSVITNIDLGGQVGGRAYQEKLAPELNFRLDAAELYIIRDNVSGADPFSWGKTGFIPGAREESNTIPILGINLAVFPTRIISILDILAALTGLGVLGLPFLRVARQDELAAIRLKYGHMLIQVDAQPSSRSGAPAKQIIDVKSFDDLARLAQHSGMLIMEKIAGKGDQEHHFLVIAEPYSYRYILHTQPNSDVV